MTVRSHLEAAQVELMGAQAQAKLEQDRAIYQHASTGQMRPVLRTAERVAAIDLLIKQINSLFTEDH
jgi:hypothetical protein